MLHGYIAFSYLLPQRDYEPISGYNLIVMGTRRWKVIVAIESPK